MTELYILGLIDIIYLRDQEMFFFPVENVTSWHYSGGSTAAVEGKWTGPQIRNPDQNHRGRQGYWITTLNKLPLKTIKPRHRTPVAAIV